MLKVLSQMFSVLLKRKAQKIAFRIKGKMLRLRLQIFPKQKKWEAHYRQQNALGQIKALKINAYMITKMFDFTAQRKFLWVFR